MSKYLKLTKKDFNVFKKAIHKYVDFFGLKDWHILVTTDETESFVAYTQPNFVARHCVFTLATLWTSDPELLQPTVATLDWIACHEVLHLLLAGVEAAATDDELGKTARREAVAEAEHAVIQRFKNSVYPLIRNKV